MPMLLTDFVLFSGDVDYGMLVKIYGADKSEARRYSPAKCLGARRGAVITPCITISPTSIRRSK
jgi:hypothetical protein